VSALCVSSWRRNGEVEVTEENPKQTCKFGRVLPGGKEEEFLHANVWAIEKTTGPDRLVIAPARDHVSLLIRLCMAMPEPFGVLYVLAVPRGLHEPGRYQSPEPMSLAQLVSFLNRFRRYLEGDGRHGLWLGALDKSFMLVYEKHNLIYGYGPLAVFAEQVEAAGLRNVGKVSLPFPHVHYYNDEFDEEQAAIMSCLPWKAFPLGDDD
jgi:hypothetical protein